MGEVIRARRAARPFVPFRLALTDRSAHDVLEPDLAVVEDEVVRVFVRPNGRTLRAVISLPHVVLVEDADGPMFVASGN